MNQNYKFLVYFLFGAIHIYAVVNRNPEDLVFVVSKALLMPCLIVAVYAEYKNESSGLLKKLMLALIFSWIGDVVLLDALNIPSAFIFGLLSFLIAHLIYIRIFLKERSQIFKTFKWPLIIFSIALLAWAILIFSSLYPTLYEMTIPVIIYILVILAMAYAALSRKGVVGNLSFWLVMLGAISFMFSDMVLAMNKFAFRLPGAGMLIMTSYILAQFLIVKGILIESVKEKSANA